MQQRAAETRAALLEGAAKVFAQKTYAEARLKDIANASQVSEGALYFHFGNKDEIARAVLEAQQERMTEVLTRTLAQPGEGLEKVLEVFDGMSRLMAADAVVQGGIKLSTQPITGVENAAREPYFEWIRIARALLERGIEDGSVDPALDVALVAEFVNAVFVGSQVLSELEDSWASFPARARRFRPLLVQLLRGDRTEVEGDDRD